MWSSTGLARRKERGLVLHSTAAELCVRGRDAVWSVACRIQNRESTMWGTEAVLMLLTFSHVVSCKLCTIAVSLLLCDAIVAQAPIYCGMDADGSQNEQEQLLMELGVSASIARAALSRCAGDVQRAADWALGSASRHKFSRLRPQVSASGCQVVARCVHSYSSFWESFW